MKQKLIISITGILLLTAFAFAQETSLKELKDQAFALFQQKKYQEAIDITNKALEIAEMNYGFDSAQAAEFKGNLGALYRLQGEEDKGLGLIENARILRNRLGVTGIPLGIETEAALDRMLENKTRAFHQSHVPQNWIAYQSKKYKYEIKYPPEFRINFVGLEPARDGRVFNITADNSMFHGLNGAFLPDKTLKQIAQDQKVSIPSLQDLANGPIEKTLKSQVISWSKIEINGIPAIKQELKFQETQEVISLTVLMDHFIFVSSLAPSIGFDARIVEDIISTFHFIN